MRLLGLLLLLATVSSAQVCVTWPRGNSYEARQTRANVSEYLESLKVATADCVSNPAAAYQYELWFYPYSGSVDSGITYFYATVTTAPNTIAGQLITSQPSVEASAWAISLWPRGEYRSVYRDDARQLDKGLKTLVKKMKLRRIAND